MKLTKYGMPAWAALPCLCLCFLFTCSCAKSQNMYTTEIFAMNTVMTLTAYGENAREAVDNVSDRVNALDRAASRTAEDSDISKINANAGGTATEVSGELSALLTDALKFTQETDGCFNPALAPVKTLWEQGGEDNTLPSGSALSEALALSDTKDISIDGTKVTLAKAGMGLDLGGIAKGYAAAEARDAVLESGVSSALLVLGSSIAAVGSKPDGSGWRIGIRDPDGEANEYLGVLTLSDRFITSSGDYERFVEINGVSYHHIIDPATGYPAQSGLRSVTIVGQSEPMGDALSTALFVMGLERALAFRSGYAVPFEAVFVTDDGRVVVTDGLRDVFEPVDTGRGYRYEYEAQAG